MALVTALSSRVHVLLAVLRLDLYQDCLLLRWSEAVPCSLRQCGGRRRLGVHVLLPLLKSKCLDIKLWLRAPEDLLGLAVDHDSVLAHIFRPERVTPQSEGAAPLAVVVGRFEGTTARIGMATYRYVSIGKISCRRILGQHALWQAAVLAGDRSHQPFVLMRSRFGASGPRSCRLAEVVERWVALNVQMLSLARAGRVLHADTRLELDARIPAFNRLVILTLIDLLCAAVGTSPIRMLLC